MNQIRQSLLRAVNILKRKPTGSTALQVEVLQKKQEEENARWEKKPRADKYRCYQKSGPELEVTRLLMINGPLKAKELWRSYQNKIAENGSEMTYFNSVSHLKKTLKNMRANEKIKSAGYDKRQKQFRGWRIEEKRALKFVHPQVIENIQEQIKKRDEQ